MIILVYQQNSSVVQWRKNYWLNRLERWQSGWMRRSRKPLYRATGIGGSNPPLSAKMFRIFSFFEFFLFNIWKVNSFIRWKKAAQACFTSSLYLIICLNFLHLHKLFHHSFRALIEKHCFNNYSSAAFRWYNRNIGKCFPAWKNIRLCIDYRSWKVFFWW